MKFKEVKGSLPFHIKKMWEDAENSPYKRKLQTQIITKLFKRTKTSKGTEIVMKTNDPYVETKKVVTACVIEFLRVSLTRWT